METFKLFASKKNWIDLRSVETLRKMTAFRGVKRVVGLPDLSVGLVPNGSAVLTEDVIYPHLIGGDIGCGMSLFSLDHKVHKIKLDRCEKQLQKLDSFDELPTPFKPLGYNLGTIGKGNHFAELHKLEKVYDQSLYTSLNIDKNRLYTLIHSGSRAFGQRVFDSIAGTYDPSQGIEPQTQKAKEYLKKHNEAIIFAKKSREIIAHRFIKAMKIDASFHLISDTAHNSITQTPTGWLHRKGATPTDKGCVIIAGSRGSLSYLVMPTDQTEKSNFSLAHGAGRKWERKSAQEKLRNNYPKSAMLRTALGTRVVCNDKNLLYEEAPQAYKNIETVIDDLVSEGLARVIASFRPLITYKEV